MKSWPVECTNTVRLFSAKLNKKFALSQEDRKQICHSRG